MDASATTLCSPGELSDGVVLLRAFTDSDVPALVGIVEDLEIRNRNHVPEPTESAVSAWVRQTREQAASGQAFQFAVCDAASGRLAGRRGIRLDAENRRASVGCWLAPQWRGLGFAPRSARLLAEWVFAHWPVDRIGAECDIDNLSSYRSLVAAGFHHDGVLRSYVLANDGTRRDQHAFSLLASDLTS